MKNKRSSASQIALLLLTILAISSVGTAQHAMQTAAPEKQNKLVQTVREATKQYLDINNAVAAGYAPFLGCVSGSDHGAMGVHYVNANLLNGTVNITQPQALIYEPSPNGQMKLVGVEYIADATTWLQSNSTLRSWMVRCFFSSTAQIDTTYHRSSNFTSGHGGTTRRDRL